MRLQPASRRHLGSAHEPAASATQTSASGSRILPAKPPPEQLPMGIIETALRVPRSQHPPSQMASRRESSSRRTFLNRYTYTHKHVHVSSSRVVRIAPDRAERLAIRDSVKMSALAIQRFCDWVIPRISGCQPDRAGPGWAQHQSYS